MRPGKYLSIFIALAILLATTSLAVAAPPGSEANCPAGKLVINLTQKVLNDSGAYQSYYNDLNGLTFGMMEYNRLIQVWEVGPGSYCAEVRYDGTFATIAGGSPGGTDPSIAAGITGNVKGSYVATFNLAPNPSPAWSSHGNLGTIDYACVAEPDAFDCPGYANWVEVFFSGYPGDFDYASHDFQFRTPKNGTFIQHLDTFEGDITD